MTDENKPLIVMSQQGLALPALKCPRMVVNRSTGSKRHCGARVRADGDGRPVCAQKHRLTPKERLTAEAHFLNRLSEAEASRTPPSE